MKTVPGAGLPKEKTWCAILWGGKKPAAWGGTRSRGELLNFLLATRPDGIGNHGGRLYEVNGFGKEKTAEEFRLPKILHIGVCRGVI